MEKQTEINLFPVIEITTGTFQNEGIILRMDYITGPMLDHHHPTQGLHYLLSPLQADYLAQQIQLKLQLLQTCETPEKKPLQS